MNMKKLITLTLKSILRSTFALVALATGWIGTALGANQTWNPTPTDENWATAGNWVGLTAPGATSGTTSADTATFDSNSSFLGVATDANRNIKSITFDTTSAGAFIIGSTGGNSLLLTSAGAVTYNAVNNANNMTVNAPLQIQTSAGTYSFTANQTGTGLLNIGGGITGVSAATKTTTLTINGTSIGNNQISGIIGNGSAGGTLSLTKSGSGTWTLSNANTYSGGITLSAGTLNINNASALGSGTFTFASNISTIDNTSGAAIINSQNNAQSWGKNFTFIGSSDLNLGNGAVTMIGGQTVTVNANTLTVGGNISGSGALAKSGAGTLVLGGSNTFATTGTPMTLNAGTLKVTNPWGLIQSGTLSVFTPSTLQLATDSGVVSACAINIYGGTLNIVLDRATPGSGDGITNTFGALTFNPANSGITYNFIKGANVTSGSETIVCTGQSSIARSGATDTIVPGMGTTVILSGGVTSLNNTTLALDGTSAGNAIRGTMSDGGGPMTVTKQNTSTWTLSGSNTFTGATAIYGGTLKLDYSTQNNSKLADAAILTLGGGTLELAGGSHTDIVASVALAARTVSIVTRSSGNAVLRMGAITNNTGTINFSADSIASTTKSNDFSGILGTWATIGGIDLAMKSATLEGNGNYFITAYNAYTNLDARAGGTGSSVIPNISTANIRINTDGISGNMTLAATTTTNNTLLQNNGNYAATVDTVGKTFRTAGIMIGSGKEALTIGVAAGDGTLTATTSGGNLALINNSDKALTVNANIGANGASTLTTSGNVLLNSSNSFTGATTIYGGTLVIGGSSVQTLSGAIGGTGSLTQTGGILTLTGVNTYSGATLVTNGAKFVGATGGSCANSAVTVADASTNRVNVLTSGGQWTCTNLTYGAGATTLEFNFGFTPHATTAPLKVNGNITFNGTLNVNVSATNVLIPSGIYPLIKYTGTLSGTPPTAVTMPSGMTATISNNTGNTSIDLVVTGGNQTLWAVGDGEWDINTTANWKDANGTAITYFDPSFVKFDDTASGSSPIIVTLNTTVNPIQMLFTNATKNYIISGSGRIITGSALAKTLAGAFTLAVPASFSGATTVDGGGTLNFSGGIVSNSAASTIGNGNSNNTLNVLINGLWYLGNQNLTVGSGAATNNTLTVNAGIVTNSNAINIGNAAGANINSMVITNSGRVFSAGASTIGTSSSNNTVNVMAGGLWHLGNQSLTIGSGASTKNALTVNAGIITNAATISVGYNTASATSRNTLTIGNGGKVYNTSGDLGGSSAGGGGGSNVVIVTDSGSVWKNSSTLKVGRFSSFNTLTITNGGKVYNTSSQIGGDNVAYTANQNAVVVTDPGSVWSNSLAIVVGSIGTNLYNSLSINSGGQVYSTGGTIGNAAGANSNQVAVTGTDSLWNLGTGTLTIGNATSTGNRLNLRGGVVKCADLTINNTTGNAVDFTAGSKGILYVKTTPGKNKAAIEALITAGKITLGGTPALPAAFVVSELTSGPYLGYTSVNLPFIDGTLIMIF